jgi:hypothetical protein
MLLVFCLIPPVRGLYTEFYLARQARFGGILDHGHEAAVYRNENKTLAFILPVQVILVDRDLRKRYHTSTFGAWAVFTMLQTLSENVTVCNSVAEGSYLAGTRLFHDEIDERMESETAGYL